MQSRLGVLELGDSDTDHDLLLTSGVNYALRNSAHLRYPAPPQPTGSSAPKEPQDGSGLPASPGPSIRRISTKTSGAIPTSTAGLLANPRFTALGGSGKQRAAFSNGNIIVDSESSSAVPVLVTVTLRGFIGNLRHPAKHVVVYTRSVRPSRQFYGEQPPLEGRPILRKTSEYVELPKRTAPIPRMAMPRR